MSQDIFEQVMEITRENIDSGYLDSRSSLESYALSDEKHLVVVFEGGGDGYEIAEVGEDVSGESVREVLGYMMCGSYGYDEYDAYLNVDIGELLGEIDGLGESDFPVFLFQSFAVRDGWKGRGVGSTVGGYCVSELSHAPYIAGLWERESDERNKSVASDYLERVCTIEDYYPDSWDCPECDGSCSCPSAFYVRLEPMV